MSAKKAEDEAASSEPLFALGAVRSTLYVEPTLAKSTVAADRAEARGITGSHQAAQGAYLTASGTLTQFNAIMAAIHGVVFSTEGGLLKAIVAAALLLHVLAAFILCWAARPVSGGRPTSASMALMSSVVLVDDTFKNYRRGWRWTMVALSASTVALALVLLHSLTAVMPTALAKWF